ncbi:MAG: hypothetical protein AVDCRST_MAG02-3567 [uncultured Rubrobacteraceae bacterium]|uniref:Major facilitator superfamily (MFS) profile domain-containing protein n=1 Tax=uncultured Rubrobacteraceae bacterium TaxID=349277 RepID=A0A6J4RCK7_9ACTN|nr:MAG: hypothetical protein AVDCRST_MAG02-3567 [uncultured Rubrobacteraceae bacterium]
MDGGGGRLPASPRAQTGVFLVQDYLSRFFGRPKPDGLWRHPGFLRLWAAQTVSGVGSQVTIVALPLLAAIELDASPGEMGLLAATGTVPSLLIGLFTGVWVDRLRRGPLLVFADLARVALLFLVPVAWAAGWLGMGLLYAVSFGVGSLTVVFEVAALSLLPALVGRGRPVEANEKLEASRSLAQIGGPGIAGGLVGAVGAPLAVLLDAVSYLVSAAFLVRLGATEEASSGYANGPRHVRREMPRPGA